MLPAIKAQEAYNLSMLVFTLTAVCIFGLFAISPTVSTIVELQKQINDNKDLEKQLDKKINDLTILQQQYKQIESDLSIIDKAIPSNAESTYFMGQIQALAQKNSISTINMSLPPLILAESPGYAAQAAKTTETSVSAYDFSLSLAGSFTNAKSFLDLLVSFDRITTLDSISISEKEDNTVNFNLKGKIYYKN